MTIELAFQTQFEFPRPKQFYRKIEDIFKNVDKIGPAESFASTFLQGFYETLASDLGVDSIHLYERDPGYVRLLKTWGDSEEDFPHEVSSSIFHCQELPWLGDLNHRKAAAIPLTDERNFWMVFFAKENLSADPSFLQSYASAFSTLHYALAQNLKWMELQDSFEQARSIQKSLLPSGNPQFADFDIAAVSISAMQVGGDVYDFQSVRPDSLSITIADAAGHGLGAALQARDVITGIRMGVASALEITKLAAILNRVIHQSGLVTRFVSVIHGELFADGWFQYVNAGHPLPLLFDRGDFRQMESTGMILGPQSESSYQFKQIRIPSGAALVLFTDGLIEHHRPDGSEFGIDGLKSWMEDWHGAPASMAVKSLFQRLYDFGHGKPFHDDVTVLYIARP